MLLLLASTLLINKVGVITKSEAFSEYDDGLCEIDLNGWYIEYTAAVVIKLLLTIGRYYLFKRNRKENIPLYLVDLVVMNTWMTVIFVKANLMYFSDKNFCWITNDSMTRTFYHLFCLITALGYLQFVWCILLSCSIPLSAFLIYQLVEYRLNSRREGDGEYWAE